MLIDTNSKVSVVNVAEVTDSKRIEDSRQALVDPGLLDLEQEATLAESLRKSLEGASPEVKKEAISDLKDFARIEKGSKSANLIDSKMPGIEKEAEKGVSIERLLELLFALMRMLGEANTQRTVNAGKVGEWSENFARSSGDHQVGAANSNLVGSIVSLGVGVGVAGTAAYKLNKAAKLQTQNVNYNQKPAMDMHTQAAKEGSSLHRTGAPNGGGAQDNAKLVSSKGNHELEPSGQNIRSTEQAPIQTRIDDRNAAGNNKNLIAAENQPEFMRAQMVGHSIMGFTQVASALPQNAFAVQSAGKAAESKMSDAHRDISNSIQHNDEQTAQRTNDLVAKVLSLLGTTWQDANQNVGQLLRAFVKA